MYLDATNCFLCSSTLCDSHAWLSLPTGKWCTERVIREPTFTLSGILSSFSHVFSLFYLPSKKCHWSSIKTKIKITSPGELWRNPVPDVFRGAARLSRHMFPRAHASMLLVLPMCRNIAHLPWKRKVRRMRNLVKSGWQNRIGLNFIGFVCFTLGLRQPIGLAMRELCFWIACFMPDHGSEGNCSVSPKRSVVEKEERLKFEWKF